MGTRADYYVGKDPKTMEWLGSNGHDGYWLFEGKTAFAGREGKWILPKTEQEYRELVFDRFKDLVWDATLPDQGWPWPWPNSGLTDYAYTWDSGKLWFACRSGWQEVPQTAEELAAYVPPNIVERPPAEEMFPDMTSITRIAYGPRSGLLILQR